MDARYAGCASVREGPTCLLPADGDLSLWLPDAQATQASQGPHVSRKFEVRLSIDGRVIPARVSELEAGTRIVVAASELRSLPLSRSPSLSLPLPLPRVDEPSATLRVFRGGAQFTLALAAAQPLAGEIVAAFEHKRAKRYAEARDQLLAFLAEETSPEALSLLARVERALGNFRIAEARYHEAIDAHRRAGNLSAVVDDTTALVFVLIQHDRRFAESRRLLDGLVDGRGAALAGHSDSVYLIEYYRGLLSRKIADHRNALSHLRLASLEATRFGDTKRRGYADQILGHSLAETGRIDEALELMDRALDELPTVGSECARMALVNNYAWQLLLEEDASELKTTRSGEGVGDPRRRRLRPRALLREALELASGPCAGFPGKRETIQLNLALAALHDGDLDGAEENLASALRPRLDSRDRDAHEGRALTALDSLWARDIRGRLASARGKHEDALAHYAAMSELATNFSNPPGRWRALVGRAQAHAALGQPERAQALWQRADALLDTDSLLVPIHARRDRFLGRRGAATERHLESLLASGDVVDAFRVARHARARHLRSLANDQRLQSLSANHRRLWDLAMEDYRRHRESLEEATANAWQLPSDSLPVARRRQAHLEHLTREALDQALALLAPQSRADAQFRDVPDGTLVLATFPLASDWAIFAQDARGIRVHRVRFDIETANAADLSAALLAPFTPELERNSRVVVMTSGASRAIDFHALPLRGHPLLATHRVAYSLDLPPRARAGVAPANANANANANETEATILVVADPRGDLPRAREEGARVRELATGGGVKFISGNEATGAAVRALIPLARTFHFAGHGDFAESNELDSALSLADDTRLTVADVLALPHAPERVVLVGCETGKTATETPLGSLGLAQAFLISGSGAIAASTRPIRDSLGERFTELLYQQNSVPFEDAVQDAQRALLRDYPGSDWASFRLLIP